MNVVGHTVLCNRHDIMVVLRKEYEYSCQTIIQQEFEDIFQTIL